MEPLGNVHFFSSAYMRITIRRSTLFLIRELSSCVVHPNAPKPSKIFNPYAVYLVGGVGAVYCMYIIIVCTQGTLYLQARGTWQVACRLGRSACTERPCIVRYENAASATSAFPTIRTGVGGFKVSTTMRAPRIIPHQRKNHTH